MATLSSVGGAARAAALYDPVPSVSYKLWERGKLKFLDLVSLEDLNALLKIKTLKTRVFDENKIEGFTKAILDENQDVARFFLEHGVNVQGSILIADEGVYEELTWLGFAIKKNKPRSVRLLLEHGADTHQTDGSGWGNLAGWRFAASSGSFECLQVLLDFEKDSKEKKQWPTLPLFHSLKFYILSEEQRRESNLLYTQSIKMIDLLISRGVIPTEKQEYLSLVRTWASQKAFDQLKEGILLAKRTLGRDEYREFIQGRLICEIYEAFKKFHPKGPFPLEIFDFLIEEGAIVYVQDEEGYVFCPLLEEAIDSLDEGATAYCFSKGVPLDYIRTEDELSVWEHLISKHKFKQARFLSGFGINVQSSTRAWHFMFEEFFRRLELSSMHYAYHSLLASSEPSEAYTDEGFVLEVPSKSSELFEGYRHKETRFRLEKGRQSSEATIGIAQSLEEKTVKSSRAAAEEYVDEVTVLPAHGGAGCAISRIKEEKEASPNRLVYNRFLNGLILLRKICGKPLFFRELKEFLECKGDDFHKRYVDFFSKARQHPLRRILDLPETMSMEKTVDLFFDQLLIEFRE